MADCSIETLRKFEGVIWSAECVGPALAHDERALAQAVEALTTNGALAPTLSGMLLTWTSGFHALFDTVKKRTQASNGLEAGLYFGARRRVAFPRPARRVLTRQEAESRRNRLSSHIRTLGLSMSEYLELETIIRDADRAIWMSAQDAVRDGRALVFLVSGGMVDFLQPEEAACCFETGVGKGKEIRAVLSEQIPRSVLRIKGEGPKTKQRLRAEEAAREHFERRIQEATPYKPWRTKRDAIEDLREQFGLSENQANGIWRARATSDIKAGRKKPST